MDLEIFVPFQGTNISKPLSFGPYQDRVSPVGKESGYGCITANPN